MDNKEIQGAIARIAQLSYAVEDAYIESEGEVTPQIEAYEAEKQAISELLAGDGIDSLGRWLKSKEDQKKALKAEKDMITRRMASVDRTIDYVKAVIYEVMGAAGLDKAKGTCYSFTPYVSRTTEVNTDLLKLRYSQTIEDAIRAAGVPDYVTVSLKASGTRADEVGCVPGDEDIFAHVSKPAVRFVKPRASKED